MIKEKFLFGTTFSFCNVSGKFTFELLLSWYTYVGIWKPPTRRKRRTRCIYPELCAYAQTTVFIIIAVFLPGIVLLRSYVGVSGPARNNTAHARTKTYRPFFPRMCVLLRQTLERELLRIYDPSSSLSLMYHLGLMDFPSPFCSSSFVLFL